MRMAVAVVLGFGCAALGQVGAGATRYDGHKVVRVTPATARQLQTLLALTDDVWSHRVGIGGPVDVRVSPEQWAAVQAAGLQAAVLIDNVQGQIDGEAARLANRAPAGGLVDGPQWFDDFKTYQEHRAFLEDLAAAHPDLAQVFVAGQTLEGRDIFGIRITGPGGTALRPAALYQGAQHCREWATPPTVSYIAYQLLENYGTDCRVTGLVDNVEFFLIPIVNVDGYEWTWNAAGDRLWRKNKRPGCTTGRYGVDLNRNWGYEWGGQGASTNPCNDTYRGPSAFSEPETQVIRDFVLGNPRIKATMDFHSYGQLVMSPWGYTDTLPPDHPVFDLINNRMTSAIFASSGRQYTPGPIFTTIYPASGTAVDWGYGAAGAWAFTIEVRPIGNPGFILPPEQILPNAEENYRAILELSSYVAHPLDLAVSGVPAYATPGQPTPVTVNITPTSGTLAPGTAQLFTRVGGTGAFTASALTPGTGTAFDGELPSAACGQQIEYYVRAQATDGRAVMFPSCGEPAALSVTALAQEVVFSDTFESAAPGWTVANGASLTSGAWERVVPVGSSNGGQPAAPGTNTTPGGTQCYVTQNGAAGGQAGAADVDGGPTQLVSPAIDLSGAQGAAVTFSRWAYSVNGSRDPFTVEVSNDDGQSWSAVSSLIGTGGWAAESFQVEQFVPLSAAVRVRFTATDSPNDSLTEGAIDDFTVTRLFCEAACYADCNGDGGLNLADFGCFQTKFATGDPYADCNGDGVLNLADFGCFQTGFALGCP